MADEAPVRVCRLLGGSGVRPEREAEPEAATAALERDADAMRQFCARLDALIVLPTDVAH